jgi:LPS sulfotransferase NodH
MFDKRIIIGGLPRSGSTLLRLILDASNCIVSGPETNFFYVPIGEQQKKVDKVAESLAQDLEIKFADAREAIMAARTSISAYDGIMAAFCRKIGEAKTAWAEKTPRNCYGYHRLALEDPNAYFISTIRNGLDVVTSRMDHKSPGDAYYCSIQRYVDSMRCVHGFNHHRHFILKYEDLVRDPAATIIALFAFLGLEYQPRVLEEFNRQSKSRDFTKVLQPKLQQPIQTTWIDRYLKPEHAIKVDEFVNRADAMEWLARSGYQLARNRAQT